MTARRARESPRLIAASVLAAIVLVLIGLLIGSATAGGSTGAPPSKVTALRHTNAAQAAQLQADARELASLRHTVGAQATGIAIAKRLLAIDAARTRCWRARALHPSPQPTVNCATVKQSR